MSFLNRMMASIGIGSATVDTRLENAQVRAGEALKGVVQIRGGSLPQQVSQIYLHLMTEYRREVNDRQVRERVTIERFQVTDPFTVGPGENREVPFSVRLPDDTPITVGRTQVWLRTGLDVPSAVDPTDQDYLAVLPHRYAQVVLDAIEGLGFRLWQAECEYSRRLGTRLPFIQEFEYRPTGRYHGRLDELEAVFFPHQRGVDVMLEVDRRARGLTGLFEEALGADERRLKVEFLSEHLAQGPGGVAGYLEEIIRKYTH